MAKSEGDINLNLPEGDTLNDNAWTRFIEEKLQADLNYVWTVKGGDPYTQKLKLAIASNDLPDMFLVGFDEYLELIKNDMIEDLTDTYKIYASDGLKEMYTTDGGKALETLDVDGKIYGISSMSTIDNNSAEVWVRQDWLDKLNLEAPTNLERLKKVTKAFIEQDPDGNGKKDTVGIPGQSTFFKADMLSFDAIFNQNQSFPGYWIKDKSGEVVYGSTTPETKEALRILRDMYAEGLINKEFGAMKSDQASQLIASNKSGIFFGSWWAGWSPLSDSVKNDPSAVWRAYTLKQSEDGPYYAKQERPIGNILVVKKGFSHPEAAIKILNWEVQMQYEDQSIDPYKGASPPVHDNALPINLQLWRADSVLKLHELVVKLSAGEKLDEATYDGPKYLIEDATKVAELWTKGEDWLKQNSDKYGEPLSRVIGVQPLVAEKNIRRVYSEFYGKTKTMEKKWVNLSKLEDTAFMQIVLGNKPLDYFDQFVEEWNKQGGSQITEEVREQLK
ncbi:extracellular solute-binding protein [Paenibacillus dokdonensis]|uniref:extracellular solute-binding protein n=1 Tax=Paenibacillus dokdonensis TaxID=2567944 RepID=UPI001457D99A|nr:extracellular solute-binding protein [Paenibacillus dokdonensis]